MRGIAPGSEELTLFTFHSYERQRHLTDPKPPQDLTMQGVKLQTTKLERENERADGRRAVRGSYREFGFN